MTATAIPFHWDLKSVGGIPASTAVELEDGQLLVEGWGANYDLDRESEAFSESAFTRGLRKFLDGNAPLLYHHKYDTVIGKVVAADLVPGKGVRLRAIVDRQPESSPLRWIYNGVKAGRINGLSVGGIFRRDGNKIVDVDILEWSATPVPVGRGTTFAVIAGKAMSAPDGKAITSTGDLTDTADVWADIGRLEQAARELQRQRPTRAYVVNGHVVEGKR